MSSKIQVLDAATISQIAAGEVISRPASIVKELLDNCIDAQATQITVDILGGGIDQIIITDNGVGIAKDDLKLAFVQHATSKLSSINDLARILSMGFRGEALASIGSVAKCELISKPKLQELAYAVEASPSVIKNQSFAIKPAAFSLEHGTKIIIEDLFYNLPVRKKYLKSEKTEALQIERIIKNYILAYPSIEFAFKTVQCNKVFSRALNSKQEYLRLEKICGSKFASCALSVNAKHHQMQLTGFIANQSFNYRHNDLQYFFINNRIIKDKLIIHAIRSAWEEIEEVVLGTLPCYVLNLQIPPNEMDVNIHPSKTEVRFLNPNLVYDFLRTVVTKALTKSKEIDFNLPKNINKSNNLVKTSQSNIACSKVEKAKDLYHVKLFENFLVVEKEHRLFAAKLQEDLITNFFLSYFQSENITNIDIKPLLFPFRIKTLLYTQTQWESLGIKTKQVGAGLEIIAAPVVLQGALEYLENIEKNDRQLGLKDAIAKICAKYIWKDLSNQLKKVIVNCWLVKADNFAVYLKKCF